MEPVMLGTYLCVFSYLLGSFNSAIVVSKIFDLPDPRVEGSKNPGATNVLRLAGRNYAGAVLIVDVLKGLLPVLLATFLALSMPIVATVGFFAVLGHLFPLYYLFRGGKGVATLLGVYFGINFILGVVCVALWLVVFRLSRYSSAGSLAMIIFGPLLLLMIMPTAEAFLPIFIASILVVIKHRHNISRLMDGKETPVSFTGFGLKKKDMPEEDSGFDEEKLEIQEEGTKEEKSKEKRLTKGKKIKAKTVEPKE